MAVYSGLSNLGRFMFRVLSIALLEGWMPFPMCPHKKALKTTLKSDLSAYYHPDYNGLSKKTHWYFFYRLVIVTSIVVQQYHLDSSNFHLIQKGWQGDYTELVIMIPR